MTITSPVAPSGPAVPEKPAWLGREHAVHLLHEMLRIRLFEDKAVEMYSLQKIRGFLHVYSGEEAVAVGAMQSIGPEDNIVATYREHGQALARGMSARVLMAELFARTTGCSRGRGGSMHFYDASRRFYGGYAVVGEGIPVAVGLALADKKLNRPAITTCFFGDGAVAEGEFHESMNLAALWNLPVLFLCENNYYAMGTALSRYQAQTDIAAKGAAYGVAAGAIDGMDVLAVEAAARRVADRVREGRPFLLECRTYRFRAHSMYDPELYRPKSEVEEWRRRDPITTYRDRIMEWGLITQSDVDALQSEVEREIADAVAFAESSPLEAVEDLTRDVTTPASGTEG